MKRCLGWMLLLLLLPVPLAKADREQFETLPRETLAFEGWTDQSVTLLYGDERYIPGAVGMVYADLSTDASRELPLLAVFFVHDGGNYSTMTVTAGSMRYNVTTQSNLNKSGIAGHPDAFHIAVGPTSIDMFQAMAVEKKVTITFGPAKDRYEIILTTEKKELIRRIAAEYTGHILPLYQTLEDLDRKRLVDRPAAVIQIEETTGSKPTYHLLTTKSTGSAVKKLQRYLIYYGYLKGTADGKYSKAVYNAVKKYQKKIHMSQTGRADAKLQQKLYAKEIPWTPAVTLDGSALQTMEKEKILRFALKNVDCEYTITGAHVIMRVLDEKGRPLSVNGLTSFAYPMDGFALKPGKAYLGPQDTVSLAAFPGAMAVEAGIVRYTLSDGTIVHVPTEKIEWKTIGE
ncbi:MAG: peptidoglycan-binding protein [Clostridia bacterium]|nr:peptidoglycan-binding protein [Clostridia bacterium]